MTTYMYIWFFLNQILVFKVKIIYERWDIAICSDKRVPPQTGRALAYAFLTQYSHSLGTCMKLSPKIVAATSRLRWTKTHNNFNQIPTTHMNRYCHCNHMSVFMAWYRYHYPTLGCDIQGFRAMGLSVQYWPRWFQDFRWSDWLYHSEQMGPIWGSVPSQKKIFSVREISCFWVK